MRVDGRADPRRAPGEGAGDGTGHIGWHHPGRWPRKRKSRELADVFPHGDGQSLDQRQGAAPWSSLASSSLATSTIRRSGGASWLNSTPDDTRNTSSAEHLDALARHVRSLDANKGRLGQLWVLDSGNAAGTVWSPGPYTARAISQHGFHGEPPPPDAFIDTLVAIAEGDARDGVVEGREWRDADD